MIMNEVKLFSSLSSPSKAAEWGADIRGGKSYIPRGKSGPQAIDDILDAASEAGLKWVRAGSCFLISPRAHSNSARGSPHKFCARIYVRIQYEPVIIRNVYIVYTV